MVIKCADLPPCPVAQAITVHDRQRAHRVWLNEEYAAAATGCRSIWWRPNIRLQSTADEMVHPAITDSWKYRNANVTWSTEPKIETNLPRSSWFCTRSWTAAIRWTCPRSTARVSSTVCRRSCRTAPTGRRCCRKAHCLVIFSWFYRNDSKAEKKKTYMNHSLWHVLVSVRYVSGSEPRGDRTEH